MAIAVARSGLTQGPRRAVPVTASALAVIVFGVVAEQGVAVLADPALQNKIFSHADWHRTARFGAQNWSLMHVARLSGETAFVQQYLFGLMPDLKAYGKYRALTEPFIVDAPLFAAENHIPQPLGISSLTEAPKPGLCSADGDGAYAGGVEDTRTRWNFQEQPVTFIRFFGYARNPAACDLKVDYVIAFYNGRILCVSRTGSSMWWNLPEAWQRMSISRSPFVFDFSCPFSAPAAPSSAFAVVAYIKNGPRLIRLPFLQN
jgi:hypothetical protein